MTTSAIRTFSLKLALPAALVLTVASVPALAQGQWVICDRFTDATRAYQGSGRGVDPQLIETLARAVHGELSPDCTLLLDLPVSVGLARARTRAGSGTPQDRFEDETAAFFERVRAGYLELARQEPGRFHVVDAAAGRTAVEVTAAILLHLPWDERRHG